VRALVAATLAVSVSQGLVSSRLDAEPEVNGGKGRATRKDATEIATTLPDDPLLGTLIGLHTQENVALAWSEPANGRFEDLLSDHTTGERHELDPRLLDLLRRLAAKVPGARIELVSGYRSPKLNERLRKKGHNVASHSQHSLGHAVDFRIIPTVSTDPMEPAAIEALVRGLGWLGGVGVYPTKSDRFVHADVGPYRRWLGK
jgi:uncharacterized protein YcbK (DUF882 family)